MGRGATSPPSPPVRVIDMARGADRDRFEMPKASLHYSKAGTQFLGMVDRPSLKPLRWGFEAAKVAENEAAAARMHSAPTGRRHDAFYLFLSNVRAEERANAHTASWDRAAERCRRTHRPPHLTASADNFLEWRCDDKPRPSTPPPPSSRLGPGGYGEAQVRPHTAPAADYAGSDCPTGWNLWRQAPQVASSPRFQARAAFDYKRCTTPDSDDVKKRTYAKLAAQRSAERAERAEREALLAAAWPHGMPTGARRAAAEETGITGMALNHGFPLSLPERQYAALKPGMKWY